MSLITGEKKIDLNILHASTSTKQHKPRIHKHITRQGQKSANSSETARAIEKCAASKRDLSGLNMLAAAAKTIENFESTLHVDQDRSTDKLLALANVALDEVTSDQYLLARCQKIT